MNAIEAKQLLKEKDGKKICLISGGETTVTVKGNGKGGRNTELALAFALEVAGKKDIVLLSAGTDGTDGPTDAAGAIVTGETIERATSLKLDPRAYLVNNDSYTFFSKTGELLITGPTGTNVMDLQIILIG
jgi:glycerate-2-kinase